MTGVTEMARFRYLNGPHLCIGLMGQTIGRDIPIETELRRRLHG